jgi:hypothetical protein
VSDTAAAPPERPGLLGLGATGALVFAAAAALGVALAWGFTVDDALISTRVARHLAAGAGYRFNLSGPVVDAVTPLGWAWLLAPLARGSAWQTLTRASLLGAGVWVAAAAWLGARCARECSGVRLGLLALTLAACLPLGAWAVSGMETALVMALGVLALGDGRAAALCAGAAAAWRPELVPWAVALALGLAIARRAPLPERLWALALALLPALLVAVCRAALFGQPAPLGAIAKPSDVEHGLRYALGALLLSGPTYLLAAGAPWRLPRERVAVAAASAVHAGVLLGVGGDWMPFWRLWMPALPGVFLVGAALLARARPLRIALSLVPALACSALLHVGQGRATRAVRGERERLIAALPALLGDTRRVASLDVGWVGAAGDHDVVDLAGVTDPEVAYLPGGHTSKRLPNDFLERRRVDALVLLADTSEGERPARAGERYVRAVEQRLARLRGAAGFQPVGQLALNEHQAYVVLRRRPETTSDGPAPEPTP